MTDTERALAGLERITAILDEHQSLMQHHETHILQVQKVTEREQRANKELVEHLARLQVVVHTLMVRVAALEDKADAAETYRLEQSEKSCACCGARYEPPA